MKTDATSIPVELGDRRYEIQLSAGGIRELGSFVIAQRPVTRAVIITDKHVAIPHAVHARDSLTSAGIHVDLITIEPGEGTKSIASASQLWQKLLELKADRKCIIVAVGGGVIGDLAGFVAATFARGLALVQVPTTLLAMVDSSVGGKVGINLPEAKNMVGAFWQPLGVMIDLAVLKTLPEREFRAGLAEVVKYGVILDEEFFRWLEQHAQEVLRRDRPALTHLVGRCCQLKAQVVSQDEREEKGLRECLNYGHTFGHAFESMTGYSALLHGEAVSMGMVCASQLSERLGRIGAEDTARQVALLSAFGLPVTPPALDSKQVVEAMKHDKKAAHGNLRFVLPERIGKVARVDDVSIEDLLAVLENSAK